MPLRRPLPKRPKQSRLQTSISGDVHEQVDLYCAHYGLTESAFFEAAALEKIGGTGQAKQIFARLSEQRRIALELKRHVEIFAELLSFHVQYSLRTMPPLPKAELHETRRHGDALYQSLIQRIGENLSSRRGFFDTFPPEPQNDAAPSPGSPVTEASEGRSARTSPTENHARGAEQVPTLPTNSPRDRSGGPQPRVPRAAVTRKVAPSTERSP